MNIGIFPGSFNPVHNGHLKVARYMLENTELDKIWFIVSPQNPLKSGQELALIRHRIKMVDLALINQDIPKEITVQFADFEALLPKPSYTYNTLLQLKKLYYGQNFSLIIGADNLLSFHNWRFHDSILHDHKLYIYPRHGYDCREYPAHPNIIIRDAPLIEVSSEMIRDKIKNGEDVSAFLPQGVIRYIEENRIY